MIRPFTKNKGYLQYLRAAFYLLSFILYNLIRNELGGYISHNFSPFFIMSLECVTVRKLTSIPFSRLRVYKNLFDNLLTWFRCPLQSSWRPAFLFIEWSFKGALRANPKFLFASIHDLYFLVAAGFLENRKEC